MHLGMTAATELCFTPATELARRIRARELSPVELLAAVLARMEALDPAVHAFITVDAERAKVAALEAEAAVMRGDLVGPLHGIPMSIKDLEPAAGAAPDVRFEVLRGPRAGLRRRH